MYFICRHFSLFVALKTIPEFLILQYKIYVFLLFQQMTIGRERLNDLAWHTVYMTRRGDTLTLKIDNNDPSAGNIQDIPPVF